jgi:NADH-quinone oxidoreductase subunit M
MVFYVFFLGVFSTWKLLVNNISLSLYFNLFIFLIGNLAAFNAGNLLTFYFFFELTSIPILYFLFIFGKRNRKTKAAQLYLSFTLLGSVSMFLALLLEYSNFDSANSILSIIFLSIAFLIKLPVFPFYLWLPEAHVESPTIGSIFLAGISLKLGGFGVYKFLLPKLDSINFSGYQFLNLLIFLLLISMLFSAISALVVHDLKKIIAYSSISHMSLFMINLILISDLAKIGGLLGMVAHSLTACSLFFLAGIIYDKMHTRNSLYMSGISIFMPLFTLFLLFNVLSNVSFPGTLAFVSEIIILFSISKYSIFLLLICLILSFIVALFSFKLIKIFYFGNLSVYSKFKIKDINRREFFVLLLFAIPQFIFGFFPELINILVINF